MPSGGLAGHYPVLPVQRCIIQPDQSVLQLRLNLQTDSVRACARRCIKQDKMPGSTRYGIPQAPMVGLGGLNIVPEGIQCGKLPKADDAERRSMTARCETVSVTVTSSAYWPHTI